MYHFFLVFVLGVASFQFFMVRSQTKKIFLGRKWVGRPHAFLENPKLEKYQNFDVKRDFSILCLSACEILFVSV